MPRKINRKEALVRGKVIVVKHGSHATNCDIISIIKFIVEVGFDFFYIFLMWYPSRLLRATLWIFSFKNSDRNLYLLIRSENISIWHVEFESMNYIVIWWKICFKREEKRKQSKKILSENFDLMSVLIPGGTSMSLGGGFTVRALQR